MILEEKSLPYAVLEEDLGNPSPALLKAHPQGQVPVLLHEGHIITESAVIAEYLDEAFPNPRLMPETPWGRAQVRLWNQWCTEIFKPDLDHYKYGWDRLDSLNQNLLVERIKTTLNHLEDTLVNHPFLHPFIMGDEFSLADIYVFPFCRQLTRVERSHIKFLPKTTAWLNRILERPSFMRAMAQASHKSL